MNPSLEHIIILFCCTHGKPVVENIARKEVWGEREKIILPSSFRLPCPTSRRSVPSTNNLTMYNLSKMWNDVRQCVAFSSFVRSH